jgi:PRTRC genetic system protein E
MFFSNMYALLETMGLSMDIKRHDDQLTVSMTPKPSENNKAKITKPLILTGTPQELDAQFFALATAPLEKTAGIIANINFYEEAISTEEEKARLKVEEAKKAGSKKEVKKEEKKKEEPQVKLLPPCKQPVFDSIAQAVRFGISGSYTYEHTVKGKMSLTAEMQKALAEISEDGKTLVSLLTAEEGGPVRDPKEQAKEALDKIEQQEKKEGKA